MTDLTAALDRFFEGCKRISDEYMNANFPSLTKPAFKIQELQKRYRVVRDSAAFCFIDKATGDVLKAASWAAPAKHARGNIYDAHNGLEKMGPYVPWLKRKPSEQFLEQCFLSLDPDERTVAAMVELGAERTILWGSDYPHFDCTYPGLVSEVERACASLPEHAKKSIREDNATRFYRF